MPTGNYVVNKTPISYSTNREIGGVAPSMYLEKIEAKGEVTKEVLDTYVESHFVNVSSCRSDDFATYFINRAKCILNAIEQVMGKPISGRNSDEVIEAFGAAV